MFPGQSSADPEMLGRACAMHPAAAGILERAWPVLGPELASRFRESLEAVPLDTNQDVQIAVFLTTQMHLAALEAAGVDATESMGLSLGEYSHLVHIGALGFEDALRLVVVRGALYNLAMPGLMVTVIGVDEESVAEVVGEAGVHGELVISNFNTPTQHVLAGGRGAVSWAAGQLEEVHGAVTVVIEERVPMHSPLMADVAEAFRPALAAASWRTPVRPYRANVLGRIAPEPTGADFESLLAAHVSQPVWWRPAVEQLAAEYPGAIFVEVGPGQVLHNMLGRRWIAPPRTCTDTRKTDPAAHFAAVVETLRD